MACYTFSVRLIIPESKYLKTAMKKKMKTFPKGGISTLKTLFSAEMKYLYIIFGLGDVSTNKLKT